MDGARRGEIKRWADGLERSEVAELRAAARALRLLCDENEQLERRVAALDRRDGGGAAPPPSPPSPSVDAGEEPPRRPRSRPRARRRVPWRLAATVVGVAAICALGAAVATTATRPSLEVGGVPANGVVGPDAIAELAFWARSSAAPAWRLDGEPVEATQVGDRVVFRPTTLAEGPHTIEVEARGRFLGAAKRRLSFRVDLTAPGLELDAPAVASLGKPVVVRGTTEPGATLVRGETRVPVDEDGRFELRLPGVPPGGGVVLQATDLGGNASRWRVPVSVVPRRPEQPIRAVHVTAYGWADKTLREGILALIRENRINAVELDLKDEAGLVGWNAPVPYGKEIGAVEDVFDLAKAVKQLHGMGVRVIGRLVCFRDPIHAQAAWKAGRRDEVVQTPGGDPYAGYGGFTNFANETVREYNIAVGVAAAKLGVDEILYDYVRRPDGPLSTMAFPGLEGTPERAIVSFLEESRKALVGTKALLGASVFGVAATRPKEVAQDIPAMARTVDYIAPMVYASHWAPGEYGVADPNGNPYDITFRSVEDFVKKVRGTGARIVPWLQDFSLGRTYGPAEVAAQIRASRDAGADEFILWDAAVTYTADALETNAARPALALRTDPPEKLPGPKRLADPKPAPAGAKPKPAAAARGPTSGLAPNELGVVPVVMHHEIRADRVGPYDQTPAELRAGLEHLWKRGYAPVSASDFVAGRIDLPKGKSPVVLTFDDSTTYQLELGPDGKPKADTAVGILLAFARTHPGFEPKATFYVLREPFGGTAQSPKLLRWLVDNGFELGNHSHDHTPLRTLDDAGVQRQLARGARVITDAVPGYRIATMALPLGSMPMRAALAVRGRSGSTAYGPYAVFLVGSGPAPSPFAKEFDRAAIPRIRSSHQPWAEEEDFTFAYWMRELGEHPERRYVSDGDPDRIAVPQGQRDRLAPRFAARAG